MPRTTGNPPGRPPLYRKCEEDGCDADHHARGLCHAHYRSLLRAEHSDRRAAGLQGTGVPEGDKQALARFAAKHEGGRRLLALADAYGITAGVRAELLAIHELIFGTAL